MGLITCLGHDIEQVWAQVLNGRCTGTRPIDRFDVERQATRIAATIEGFDAAVHFGRRQSEDTDRVTHLSLFAAENAVEAARLSSTHVPAARFGVTIGTALGGIETAVRETEFALKNPLARVSALTIPRAMTNAAAFHVAKRFGAHGPNHSVSTACSSGSLAIGTAFRMIQYGDADVVLACASDAPIIPSVFRAWCALKVMSVRNDNPPAAFRPFDLHRDGFVLGEGAAALVLEDLELARRRDAPVYAEIAGFGSTCDALSITSPSASHQAEAMRRAMCDANIQPADIGLVSAHGTATPVNDPTETAALHEALGVEATTVPVVASKPFFGHTMGASGALEFILCVLAMKHGRLYRTPNLSERDPVCNLNHTGEFTSPRGSSFMVNSFGFGGNNVVLIGRSVTDV